MNRGIQVNQTLGKYLTASFSWNDGYYSNRYSWLSGSLTYTKGPHAWHSLPEGNAGQTKYQTLATPVQNNSTMYTLIYTYHQGRVDHSALLPIHPMSRPTARGVTKGASTDGGALLSARPSNTASRFQGAWNTSRSSGSAADGAVNLMFGPGSAGTSLYRDADHPEGRPVLPRRRFLGPCQQLYAGNRFRQNGNQSQPGPSHGRSGLHLRQQRHREIRRRPRWSHWVPHPRDVFTFCRKDGRGHYEALRIGDFLIPSLFRRIYHSHNRQITQQMGRARQTERAT